MITYLLTLANAGEYPEKREFFYPFKTQLLRIHGAFDGYDKQIIQKPCWRCKTHPGEYVSHCYSCRYEGGCWNCHYQDDDGRDLEDGYYKSINKCPRCAGTGWYVNKKIWLERRKIHDRVFHIPVPVENLPLLIPDPIIEYQGVIKHVPVDRKKARRAALALFAIYDFGLFLRIVRKDLKFLGMRLTLPIRQKWNEIRYGEIPF